MAPWLSRRVTRSCLRSNIDSKVIEIEESVYRLTLQNRTEVFSGAVEEREHRSCSELPWQEIRGLDDGDHATSTLRKGAGCGCPQFSAMHLSY